MWQVLRRIAEHGGVAVVPADVIAEWWRGRTDIREHILGFVSVEPLTAPLARAAGEALAAVANATSVDAIVMASAAQRGDAVYTTDVNDLERLRKVFPEVRVFAAS
jgi:predicted nucleic acid-binding protein